MHLVLNGVDASRFHPRDRAAAAASSASQRAPRLVLFVGRLEPQKGIGELLEAFELLRARLPRATLALVGHGVATEEVRARVERWGPGGALLAGARPPEEVATWMGACDVLTLPSWAEGTPNVVLEALASGRPVVATRVGGIPDVLRDERSGLVVPPRDAGALARGLQDALERQWDEAAVHSCGPGSWGESAEAVASVLEQAPRLAGRPTLEQLVPYPAPYPRGTAPQASSPGARRNDSPSVAERPLRHARETRGDNLL